MVSRVDLSSLVQTGKKPECDVFQPRDLEKVTSTLCLSVSINEVERILSP